MKKSFKITNEGKLGLEEELDALKASRGEIAEEIATARAFGDLSENAEYNSARERQGVTETRIAEIEDILKNADIISTGSKSQVSLGCEVTLDDSKAQQVYSIVGPVEANPLEKKISDESPLGKALMGKKNGDKIEIDTPKGRIVYTIAAIR
jgi:transcription elongation factor GreA